MTVLAFYFSSKTIERVSLNVANFMAKKLELRQQSEGYGYGDYGYNNYGGYGSNYTETYSSETQSDTIRPEEDQKGEM
jgi:hypothetical protein